MNCLPHDPYIDAVIRAIREAGYNTGPDCSTEYDTDDGAVMWMEAFVDLGEDGQDGPGRVALGWRQTTGWLGVYYDGRGRYDEESSGFFADDCVLPAPAAVAAVVRQWFNGSTVWPVPGADDTTPSDGPLPALLAEALEAGDVTADLAVRLAVYWPAA
ncbi:hypothetical protein [Kitasatospora sp. NPDC094016]|uniref:DUF6292 family protein n=1 Tax=Kitasatospora sp. NPDC094016 TaxID=3154986 RepID=UPI003329D61B